MKIRFWLLMLAVAVLSPPTMSWAETQIEFEIHGVSHHSSETIVYSLQGTWKLTTLDTVECFLDGACVACQRTRTATVTFNLEDIRPLQGDFDKAFRGGVPPDIRRVPHWMTDQFGNSLAASPREEEAVRAFVEVVSQKCSDAFHEVIAQGGTLPVDHADEWRILYSSMEIFPIRQTYPYGTFDITLKVVFDPLPIVRGTEP